MNEIISIEKYEVALQKFLDEKSDCIFQNSGVKHALAFTTTIFSAATDLKMISRGLGPELASDAKYVESIKAFLDKNDSKLEIAIESTNSWGAEPLLSIRNKAKVFPERFSIRLIPNKIVDTISKRSGETFPNLMLADECIFRLENKPAEYKAFGSFNNPEQYKNLIGFYNYVFSNSKPLDPSSEACLD